MTEEARRPPPYDKPGPFKGVPLAKQIEHWRAWAAAGKRPDEHEAVPPPSVHCPEDLDFEILDDVEVLASWNAQTQIGCNLCGRPEQFKHKGKALSWADGWWYLIGPQCAAPPFEAKLAQATNQQRKREAEELASQHLTGFLPAREGWLSYWQALSGPVHAARRLRHMLTTASPNIFRHIMNAYRADGALRAFPAREDRPFEFVARLQGGEFLDNVTPPAGRYRRAQEEFSFLLNSAVTEEDLHQEILEYHAAKDLASLSVKHRRNIEAIRQIADMVDDAAAFASRENLEAISRWIRHPRSECRMSPATPHRFEVRERPDGTTFIVDGEPHELDLRPLRLFDLKPPSQNSREESHSGTQSPGPISVHSEQPDVAGDRTG